MKEPLSKTHLLKLVFIIEEISIKKYGVPFLGLRFDVWKLGPVSKDLFVELSGEPYLLQEFIDVEVKDTNTIIHPKKEFCDDEFNDLEMNLLNEVTTRFLYCTAKELINHTHKKDSPWYNTAMRNGILELLESGKMTTTDIPIDLFETIKDDEQKCLLYQNHQDFVSHLRIIKS
ncbi:MAG: SocA family protein [Chitinophagaceae bacterium]|nr:SocA family protein [Chitinophagaceae bacterium]